MSKPATINPRIVEALYCEALVLSDEVRAAFTLSGRIDGDPGRVALSSEGLRTTTRMMHAIAWLLNHRAYFIGEISDLQLRRHGRLSPAMRQSDPAHALLLEPATARLVEATRLFYDRLLRLDQFWRLTTPAAFGAIEQLRERIEGEVATGT
ncbi:DUF1465 family protein [Novosphingobium resinovorum]|uniref:DUF1465 family protein n=1 Tax=Novosphingobium TaxID=165696 RepID=UPI001B3C5383|nr:MULTISPECIES: DUF1465 family protein [Novosphingobium]MBF7010409.1 DUF1465 family protein [Novosphingobium sp. HR1a]WJM28410.1 DUF1465 family protein [Novosphingobium resinovorum]